MRSLTSTQAVRKTFELIATAGAAPHDFEPLFAPLDADPPGALDAVHDMANMPLEDEPPASPGRPGRAPRVTGWRRTRCATSSDTS